jgi:hypothetical protein
LTPFTRILLVYFLAAIFADSKACCAERNTGDLRQARQTADEKKSEIASALISVVNEYIEAGQTQDPHGRSKYLAAKVFYYGHALTNQQAEKQIVSLYRRWPTRKFGQLEEPEIFAIPKKRDIYKVTGRYDYDLANTLEHLSGKSQITCVLEHGPSGDRIIGFDEKLITDTTKYSRD